MLRLTYPWLAAMVLFSCTASGQAPQKAPVVSPALDPALASAKMAFEAAHWTDAEPRLRQYLIDNPHETQARYLLAATLFHQNKPTESLGEYTRAAAEKPPSAADLRFVALDYVLLNDYTDADKWITQSAREDPSDSETWYALGRIKYTENRFSEATASFGKALQLVPHSVKAENNLGLAYEGLNQPDRAIESYRQAIAWDAATAHPSEQPRLNLGILLTDRNQLDEALPLLQQAEALAPTDGKIHGALGKLYARRGDLPLAQHHLELAVAADAKNSGLHFQLGQVYRKQGMSERAAIELARAATLEREARH